nr:BRO family protein [Sneathia sanguinegens]
MNGIFKYETKQVRTIDDIAWFCLKDVCEILEIGNVTDTKNRLESDKFDLIEVVDKLGKKQEMLFITESGLYAVILRSNKPEAKKFRKWVTSEVLPSIRKNGAYMLDTFLDKIHLLEQRIEKLESIFYPHKHKQLLIVGNHISEFL